MHRHSLQRNEKTDMVLSEQRAYENIGTPNAHAEQCCTLVQKEENFNQVRLSLKRWRIMYTKSVGASQREKPRNLTLNTQVECRLTADVLRFWAGPDNGLRRVNLRLSDSLSKKYESFESFPKFDIH